MGEKQENTTVYRWPAPVICENSRCRSGRRLCRSRPWCLYRKAGAEGHLLDPRRLETALLALLRAAPPERFARVRGVSEGLEHRLAAAVREATSLEDLYTPPEN